MPSTSINSSGYNELYCGDLTILKSYQTIIAIYSTASHILKETKEFYSQTTSRHLSLFKRRFATENITQVEQSELDKIIDRLPVQSITRLHNSRY